MLLNEAIQFECANVGRSGLECAFRDEGVAVLLIKEFFTLNGTHSKRIVSKVVRSVVSKPELDLEIEREKIIFSLQEKGTSITEDIIDKIITKRVNILLKYVKSITTKFYEKCNEFSPAIQDFVKIMKFHLAEEPTYFYQLIGGWFFLRCIIPAIVSPESCKKLLKKSNSTISRQTRRNLILIGKVLQGIANESVFGEKESYLSVFNSQANNFLRLNIHNAIDKIAKGSIVYNKSMEVDQRKLNKVRDQSKLLFKSFYSNFQSIEAQIFTITENFELLLSQDKINTEFQEFKTIIFNTEDKLDANNCNKKWERIMRRREIQKNAIKTFSNMNQNIKIACNVPQEVSFQYSLNTSTQSLTDTSEFSILESSTKNNSEEEIDDHDTDMDEDEFDKDDDIKRMMKIKFKSKIINIPAIINHREALRTIGSKLGLKSAFVLCYLDDSKTEIALKDAEQWNNFLHNNSIKSSNGVFLYHLIVKPNSKTKSRKN